MHKYSAPMTHCPALPRRKPSRRRESGHGGEQRGTGAKDGRAQRTGAKGRGERERGKEMRESGEAMTGNCGNQREKRREIHGNNHSTRRMPPRIPTFTSPLPTKTKYDKNIAKINILPFPPKIFADKSSTPPHIAPPHPRRKPPGEGKAGTAGRRGTGRR